MDLVHEMTYHAMLNPPMPIGDGPAGSRVIFDVIDGRVEGPRITGSLRGAGGQWLLAGPDGFGRLDTRVQIQTEDGAFIYMQYTGLVEINDTVQSAAATAQETDFDDQYFVISPRFETGDERYVWLNQSVFVGKGRMYPGLGVEYEIYRIA